MLDGQNRASLNHSSVSTQISVSNSSLARLEEVGQYDKRTLKTQGEAGTVFVTSESSVAGVATQKKGGLFGGSSSSDSNSKITDTIRLEIVKHPEIYPDHKSVYFMGPSNPFTFTVLHGSGDFLVTLDNPSIAQI